MWQINLELELELEHNIAFSREKSSRLNQERYMHRSSTCSLQAKTDLHKYMWGFRCEKTTADGLFPLEEVWLWVSDNLKLKYLNDGFVSYTQSFSFHNILIGPLEWCGLLVDYCDVFISCLDSHSDGTHSLQSIHCWAIDINLHFSKSVPINKQIHLRVGKFSENFNFGVNYSFN